MTKELPGGTITWSEILLNAFVGGAMTAALLFVAFSTAGVPPPGSNDGGYVSTFRPAHNEFEALLDHGDGQAYAALARDPSLSQPEVFAEGAGQEAFFAQRPVLSYAVWALSFGRPGGIEAAYFAVLILAGALLAGAATGLVQAVGIGQDSRLAILVLIQPGWLVSVFWLGQEGLSLALGIAALALWVKRDPHRVAAGILFALGGLTRETIILVPLVLAAYELLAHRSSLREGLRRTWPLAVVRWRLGAGAASRGTIGVRFHGLVTLIPVWTAADWLVAVIIIGVSVWAIVVDRVRLLTWIVAAYLAFGVLVDVSWTGWVGFARVLLPGAAFATLALIPFPRGGAATARRSRAGPGLPFEARRS